MIPKTVSLPSLVSFNDLNLPKLLNKLQVKYIRSFVDKKPKSNPQKFMKRIKYCSIFHLKSISKQASILLKQFFRTIQQSTAAANTEKYLQKNYLTCLEINSIYGISKKSVAFRARKLIVVKNIFLTQDLIGTVLSKIQKADHLIYEYPILAYKSESVAKQLSKKAKKVEIIPRDFRLAHSSIRSKQQYTQRYLRGVPYELGTKLIGLGYLTREKLKRIHKHPSLEKLIFSWNQYIGLDKNFTKLRHLPDLRILTIRFAIWKDYSQFCKLFIPFQSLAKVGIHFYMGSLQSAKESHQMFGSKLAQLSQLKHLSFFFSTYQDTDDGHLMPELCSVVVPQISQVLDSLGIESKGGEVDAKWFKYILEMKEMPRELVLPKSSVQQQKMNPIIPRSIEKALRAHLPISWLINMFDLSKLQELNLFIKRYQKNDLDKILQAVELKVLKIGALEPQNGYSQKFKIDDALELFEGVCLKLKSLNQFMIGFANYGKNFETMGQFLKVMSKYKRDIPEVIIVTDINGIHIQIEEKKGKYFSTNQVIEQTYLLYNNPYRWYKLEETLQLRSSSNLYL